MDQRFVGIVERSTGSWYDVRREASGEGCEGVEGEVLRARLRGRLRLAGSRSTNPVVVGDRVECVSEGVATGGSQGAADVWIEAVLPRRNYIIRRSTNLSRESHIIAANVDQALVVATLFSPVTALEFIDRFLVTCEAYGIPVTVLLNKVDLVQASEGGAEALARFVEIYESAGYKVMVTSALTSFEKTRNFVSVNDLRQFLAGRTTLVSGNSGVGKSTLIGAVSPGLDIRVGEVSRAHGKGMHTTTFSQMYTLAGLGAPTYIIDTPGVKGFGLVDISPAELARYFPEMMRWSPRCEYYNCTHTHEPGCAVRRAVEDGKIAPERYESYLKMLEEDGKFR